MTIHVATAGQLTTVQDLGRSGYQRDGISPSGAMDRFAMRVANLLVGNPADAATLEITLQGPTLRFAHETVVALGGAHFVADLDGMRVPPWKTVLAHAGTTLTIANALDGCRAYLALAGGVDVPIVLGSRSTHLRARFGGFDGRALRRDDLLHLGAPSPLAEQIGASLIAADERRGDTPGIVARWGMASTLRPRYGSAPTVRFVDGAHAHLLTAAARERFATEAFRIGAQSDRMGYRLDGVALEVEGGGMEVLSEAVAFGTLQLPPSGSPIALMAERQTTGGYPRIGEVATVDLPLLAQLRPGDTVRFVRVDVGEAQRAYLEREAELTQARLAIALRFPYRS